MDSYVSDLISSRASETPRVVRVGDSHHGGTDIYWSDARQCWIFVDLENRTMDTADVVAVYRSAADGDETGLNQLVPIAVDFDGPKGVWVVGIDSRDDLESTRDDVELVWTDASGYRWKLDTENDGCDEDELIGSRDQVMADVMHHHDLKLWPEHWTLISVV